MDKFRLEYEMKKKGVSIKDMCDVLGISRSAFYRKMNEKSQFTKRQIEIIVDFLDLGSPMGIFF